jgi:hypothetical protein
MAKIIDLTDYSMEDWEGVQFLSHDQARKFILNRKLKKRALINVDIKPSWYNNSDAWKQTFTVRKIEKESSAVKKAIKQLMRK